MKKHRLFFLIAILLHTTSLFAQKQSTISIEKINGSYHKTFELPLNTRIVTHDGEVTVLHLDSITDSCFYGNRGQDSIAISNIATVNLRGTKEVLKYAAVALCGIIVIQNIPVVSYGLYRNDRQFTYIGLSIVTTFASLGTYVFFHPKTRFPTSKYKFQAN